MNTKPQFITNTEGKKISVILPLADYQELMEDLEDLATIAERKDEVSIPFEAALKEIGYDS
jgi:PHD/YefM family antitoxin component YafN of YafNO toxin-antitoxin module